jgi:pyruvate/2-oxoglutarate dehydrogenase complex dihydrolipoamide acyltransferase (E2) component
MSLRRAQRESILRYPRSSPGDGVDKAIYEDDMGQLTEVKVPDIGNYENVPVIEVLVKTGDTVAKDQGLITLESDKATMEVPSSAAGVVKEVKVKVGDEVSEGTVVVTVEAGEAADKSAAAKTEAPAKADAASKPETKSEPSKAEAPKESAQAS